MCLAAFWVPLTGRLGMRPWRVLGSLVGVLGGVSGASEAILGRLVLSWGRLGLDFRSEREVD